MIRLRIPFSSWAPMPTLLAAVLVSACTGHPPRLEAPSQVTVSTLGWVNSHPCTATVASALDAYHVSLLSKSGFFVLLCAPV
jgi:hypothetical protein